MSTGAVWLAFKTVNCSVAVASLPTSERISPAIRSYFHQKSEDAARRSSSLKISPFDEYTSSEAHDFTRADSFFDDEQDISALDWCKVWTRLGVIYDRKLFLHSTAKVVIPQTPGSFTKRLLDRLYSLVSEHMLDAFLRLCPHQKTLIGIFKLSPKACKKFEIRSQDT